MIERAFVESLSEEERKEYRKEVSRRRQLLSTEAGRRLVEDMIVSGRVFDQIGTDEPEAIAVRNFVLDVLDSMGFFQEQRISSLVRFLGSQPILRGEKEESDG